MEIETLRTRIPRKINNRSSGCTLLGFNLPDLIATMKQSYTWTNGDLNAIILLKSADKQIVLTALHEGTEIKSFQSNESVTFQIIEGKLRFHMRKDTVTLSEGQQMIIDEKIKYSVTTDVETVFLLTISNKVKGTVKN
jgi:quercetin dioxygenase-like cupin family protein